MIADGNPYVGRRLVDGYYVFGGVELDSGPEHPWFIETPSREVEFSFLKRRLYSIIIDKSFSFHHDFSDYTSETKLPFTDLVLYG